jgi:hypothetical protein
MLERFYLLKTLVQKAMVDIKLETIEISEKNSESYKM